MFDGVALSSVERLPAAAAGGNAAAAERALQAGRIALAADALGAALEGLRIAVEYAKQREQFNQVIGSFQAVKHMCAETAAALDPIQSLLWYTAYAWDQRLDEARHLAPLLKAHAGETATDAVTTCTQVFGGIGFTWECDMHIYFKRVGYDRQVLGSPGEVFALAAALRAPAGVASRRARPASDTSRGPSAPLAGARGLGPPNRRRRPGRSLFSRLRTADGQRCPPRSVRFRPAMAASAPLSIST